MNAEGIQQALYDELTGNVALMAAITGVYADKPQDMDSQLDSVFPYVTFGQDTLTPWDTKTTFGSEAVCQIDIWSRSHNLIEVKQVASKINDALHHQTLTIGGGTQVLAMVESSAFTRDPDGKTKRGILFCRVISQRP